jgi:hypothetical protein
MYSDGLGGVDLILGAARSTGLDGLAIRDHDIPEGCNEDVSPDSEESEIMKNSSPEETHLMYSDTFAR